MSREDLLLAFTAIAVIMQTFFSGALLILLIEVEYLVRSKHSEEPEGEDHTFTSQEWRDNSSREGVVSTSSTTSGTIGRLDNASGTTLDTF